MHGLGLCLFLADDQHEAEAAEPEGQRAGNEHGTLLLLLDVTGSGLPCGVIVLAWNDVVEIGRVRNLTPLCAQQSIPPRQERDLCACP